MRFGVVSFLSSHLPPWAWNLVPDRVRNWWAAEWVARAAVRWHATTYTNSYRNDRGSDDDL